MARVAAGDQRGTYRAGAGDERGTDRVDLVASEVLAAFEEAGVDALLLKGRSLWTLLYESPERRWYGDVDLLVAPPQVAAAEQVLTGLGYLNSETDRGIDDVGGVVHGQPWARLGRGPLHGTTVDLHWRLPGSRASPDISWAALAQRRTRIELNGRHVSALDRCGQALHLAIHAAQHGPGFDKILDELALALERWPDEVWACAAGLAGQIDATQGFAAGLRLLPTGAVLASELGLPSTAELDWSIRHRGKRPRGTLHVQALQELDSFATRVQFARRSLLPPRAWILQQYRWARAGGPLVVAAYLVHLARVPVWAARALRFRMHARRAARGV